MRTDASERIADGHRRARRRLVLSGAAARRRTARAATLDKAYCDRNGDLVADAPTDPKQLVNPSTLIFAYTPVEDPAVYQKVWDGFIKHMEKVTGKKVVFFPVQSNAAQIEAMRSGRLHVAGVNTGGNSDRGELRGLRAVRDDGGDKTAASATRWRSSCRPTARSRRRPTSRARRSRSPTPTSNSGFKAPSAILKADFNLEAERDFDAGVLRQARQLDARRRQQGLRRRGDRQRGDATA